MKENLEKKLETIKAQKEQILANFNALCGAEQVIMQLLQEVQETDNSDEIE